MIVKASLSCITLGNESRYRSKLPLELYFTLYTHLAPIGRLPTGKVQSPCVILFKCLWLSFRQFGPILTSLKDHRSWIYKTTVIKVL